MNSGLSPTPIGPTLPSERIHRLDVLRGFALFGVLLVNLFDSDTVMPNAEESWIGKFVNFFVEGSFYPLFSLLFGLGFAIQMARFAKRGRGFVYHYIRRSLALIGIGILSFVFILGNPILIRYGSLAFLLLLFRKSSSKAVLVWALVTLIVVLGEGPARKAWADRQRANPLTAVIARQEDAARREESSAFRARVDRAMKLGDYSDIVAVRWANARNMLTDPWFLFGSRNMSMFMLFLLGLFTAHRGLITRTAVERAFLRRVALVGFVLGLFGNGVLLALPGWSQSMSPFMRRWITDLFYYTANPALGLAYGASLILLTDGSAAWRQRLAPLAWVGRMALTNFLLQFVFILFLFYLQRLGAFKYMRPEVAVLLSVLLFSAQVPFSWWWLSRFRFGPAEWLWRTLTFGKIQPMRGGVKALVPV